MKQSTLAAWLKAIIIGLGICGLLLFGIVMPIAGHFIDQAYQQQFHNSFLFWLFFTWLAAIPCYAVLFFAWKVAVNIGKDQAFSIQNAKLIKNISVLAAADTAFFLLGNLISLIFNMNHPAIILFSLFIMFIGIAISVAAFVLSHLIAKAHQLQEQSDWTI